MRRTQREQIWSVLPRCPDLRHFAERQDRLAISRSSRTRRTGCCRSNGRCRSGPWPFWKDVVDRVGKALQALDDSDRDVGNTAVPQIMTTWRPENPKCRHRCIRRRLRWTTAVLSVGPRGSGRFTRERPATPARGSGDASVLHDPAFDSFAGLANVLGEQCTLLNSLENPLGFLAI